MNLLQRIAAAQRALVARRRRERPLRELRAAIDPALAPRGTFARALRRGPAGRVRVICELAPAGVRPGPAREPFDPAALARAYASGGADAIAVVTEERFFLSARDTILRVRRVADRPVLMRDLVVDAYQIVEARVLGADAVLILPSLLAGAGALAALLALAGEFGLECLVEVHDESELEHALTSGAVVVGVNNRDLGSFQVDLGTTERLSRLLPPGCVLVSESGIRTRDDVLRLEQSPVDAILVGATRTLAESPAQALERLLGGGT
jgi:indole-3-glycerol phosphate synthase